MEPEALAPRELKEYLMQDPDYRRLSELQHKVSQHSQISLVLYSAQMREFRAGTIQLATSTSRRDADNP
jgi:hypothetical protein